jgi:type IV pilus assembly protein PilZ|tara:strand:+ start:29169 stop:29426 length:258 start_codon:yes stop_codon:yes gene_type:complete
MEMGFADKDGVLSVVLRDPVALFGTYMPHATGGSLFIETQKNVNLGDEVFILLDILEQGESTPVSAKVIWVTPKETTSCRPGIGI